MNTRLARYCDRVIEAGWLAAVILTPLFFNIYSSRVFEPDKLTLLRSVAVLMGVAWLIRSLEQGGAGRQASTAGRWSLTALWRSLTTAPLLPQILLLILVYLLATVLSVTPRVSFWGSYQRLQGTYSTLTYCLIFFVTWQSLRVRAQLERLLNVIVLTSLPVALYGVLQHYGLDPLPWAGDVTDRVTANLGNAIFIAAYLIMAFFITLERAVARFGRLLSADDSSMADAVAGGVYLFVLALQVLAIYFSKSRGPWLGLLGGVYVFVLISLVAMRRSAIDRKPLRPGEAGKSVALALLSPLVGVLPAYLALILTRRGRRWLWLSWCIQSLLAILLLLAFNLPRTPLAPLREVPGIGRLGQVFETEGGTGRVRVLIWEGAVEMLKADPLRTLAGYGPESMYVAFNRFYPPDLAHYESRNASPDRSHNESFDALLTTGVIGFLVYIALFVGIFLYGLRWLGFLPGSQPRGAPGARPWQRTAFLALTIGGAVLGAVVPLAVDGSLRFAGVGIPAGLISGVAVFLAVSAFTTPHDAQAPTVFGWRELLLVSLLAMVVAHFIEIHFGIAIAATRIYFWIGLAALLAIGSGSLSLSPEPLPEAAALPARKVTVPLSSRRQRRRHQVQAAPAQAARTASPLSGAVASGFLGALILGTLFFGFATNAGGNMNPLQIIWSALSTIRPAGQMVVRSPGILAMVFLTWLLGVVLIVGEADGADRTAHPGWWLPASGCYLAICLGASLTFALFHASQLQAGKDLGLIIFVYYAFALAMISLAAVFLPGTRQSSMPLWREGWVWSYPLLLAVAGLLILGNATVVRADIYYKQAWDGFHRPAFEGLNARRIDRPTAQRYYDAAMHYYERAVHLAPQEDYYQLFLGKALLERAEITDDPQLQIQYLVKGEQTLLRARDLNPLNTDHTANLARLCRSWAAVSKDDATRQEKMAQSVRYYEDATRLSPRNAILYNEWGRTLLDLGRPEEALARYQQSLALDDRFAQTHTLLGDYYARQQDLGQARTYYEQAAALDPRSAPIHSALGNVYSQLGLVTEAISENLQVLDLYPRDYVSLKNLAILYGESGQTAQALAAATAARQLAPESDRAALDQFIAQLQAATPQESKP